MKKPCFDKVPAFLTISSLILFCLGACQQVVTPTVPPTTPAPKDTLTVTATRKPLPTQRPSQTPSPTTAPSLTPGPAPTSTPVPPLSAHTWQPAPVLVEAARRDLQSNSPFNLNPFFVLYADGKLILQQCKSGECRLVSQQLKPAETCRLLNTFDQLGFMDYDPTTYQSPQGGGQSFLIQVNAWRSKKIELDDLENWIQDPGWFDRQHQCTLCAPRPVILPALADTFALLTRYQAAEVLPYQAERLAVWVGQPWVEGSGEAWMMPGMSLSALYSRSRCTAAGQSQAVVLAGPQAVQLAEYINTTMTRLSAPIFYEDQLKLQIETRWLLPLEAAPGCGETGSSLPLPQAPTPAFTLSCKPADGTLSIPTPTALPPRPYLP